MTIKLLKDCPQYGRKWAKGTIIPDVYGPDARRMIEDGEAEEYNAAAIITNAVVAKKAEKPAALPPKE